MTALGRTNECAGAGVRAQRRMFGSVLTAVAAVTALAGSPGNAPTANHHETTRYSVEGDVRTLLVTAHVGDVHVTGGTGRSVAVVQHLAFHGATPTTRHRLAAGTLSLTSHCSPGEVCSVSYDITVPKATAVRVTDDVGTIRLSALTGQVSATVDAGRINLISVSGSVVATVRAGSIVSQHLSSQDARLRVSAGEIDVTFSAPPTAITASTDIGAIILRVPSSVAYRVTATAVAGHVAVSVSQNTAASRTITATTKVGSITIEP